MSVCPSVRSSRAHRYCVERTRHIIKLFSSRGSYTILVCMYETSRQYDGEPITGTSNGRMQEGHEKIAIFNQSLYLRSNTRQGHSCYRMRIRNHIPAFEWYHFEWPWTTPNPDFQITSLFDAKYLRNGTRYRHSYNEILKETYTRRTQFLSFRMTLSDLRKYSVT